MIREASEKRKSHFMVFKIMSYDACTRAYAELYIIYSNSALSRIPFMIADLELNHKPDRFQNSLKQIYVPSSLDVTTANQILSS